MHDVIALTSILYGLVLIFSDHFFKWPPFLTKFLNDDLVGGLFILCGILIIVNVAYESNLKFDAFNLGLASGLFMLLTLLELLSDIFLHNSDKPWIATMCITLVIMIVAKRGETGV